MNIYQLKECDLDTKKKYLNDDKLLEEVVKETLSEKRYLHTMEVVKMALSLARANGVDLKETYKAAILHDICKEMPKPEQVEFLAKYEPVKAKEYPVSALHGLVAKYFLEDFGLSDKVLDAIYSHTILERKTPLNMIVFISDKREASRQINDGIAQMAHDDLLGAYQKLVLDVEEYLNSNGEKNVRSSL